MADHLKKSEAGHLLKNAAGHLVNNCTPACNYCPGSTPSQVEVVFSDIDFCECSGGGVAPMAIRSGKIVDLPDIGPNGAFTLDQSPTNPCLWIKDFLCTTGSVLGYASDDCSGVESYELEFYSYRVEFRVYADHYEIRANYMYDFEGTKYPAVNVFSVGEDGEIEAADCPGSLGPHSNMLDHCAYFVGQTYNNSNYYDGTGTVGVP